MAKRLLLLVKACSMHASVNSGVMYSLLNEGAVFFGLTYSAFVSLYKITLRRGITLTKLDQKQSGAFGKKKEAQQEM